MPSLLRIAPELPAADLPAAIEYYENKLGFKCVMVIPHADYAIVERDGIALHLFQDEPRNHTPIGIHIFTRELDTLYAEFHQRGARLSQEIQRKPWGNRDFRLNDEFGNVLKFTEPI